jgi:hypothetical protein
MLVAGGTGRSWFDKLTTNGKQIETETLPTIRMPGLVGGR